MIGPADDDDWIHNAELIRQRIINVLPSGGKPSIGPREKKEPGWRCDVCGCWLKKIFTKRQHWMTSPGCKPEGIL